MNDYKIEDYKSSLFYRVKYISGMNTKETLRQDYHNSLNLIFIFFIKGRGKIKINGVSYNIKEGEMILLNSSEFFLFDVEDNYYHERIVMFTNMKMLNSFPCDCFELFSNLYKRKNGNIISSDIVRKYNIDRMFYELLESERDKSKLSMPLSISKIVEILCVINKITEASLNSTIDYVSSNSIIDNILEYINLNYTKNITIEDIAKHVKLHRSYLSHKFKEQMGVSLWSYVILRRIYKFNALLDGNESIENIAYSVGFDNYSNFFRLYKKYMGISPVEAKKEANKNNIPTVD